MTVPDQCDGRCADGREICLLWHGPRPESSPAEALHAEVVGMLDALRDKARMASSGPAWTTTGLERNGLLGWRRAHVATWSPAAVLALVGDDGLLRRQAAEELRIVRRYPDDSPAYRESVRALSDLRDALRKIGSGAAA